MSRSSHISKGKVSKKQVEKFSPVRFPERRGKQEFGLAKKEYVLCKTCQAAYYDKSWHHDLSGDKHITEKNIDKKLINFMLCPACEMIKNKQFEGSIMIYNVPALIKSDLINLVSNMGETARRIDPMDRVSKIKESKNVIEVWTTENQLAKKIANKIKSTFPKQLGKEKISFSKDESDVIRVTIGEAAKK